MLRYKLKYILSRISKNSKDYGDYFPMPGSDNTSCVQNAIKRDAELYAYGLTQSTCAVIFKDGNNQCQGYTFTNQYYPDKATTIFSVRREAETLFKLIKNNKLWIFTDWDDNETIKNPINNTRDWPLLGSMKAYLYPPGNYTNKQIIIGENVFISTEEPYPKLIDKLQEFNNSEISIKNTSLSGRATFHFYRLKSGKIRMEIDHYNTGFPSLANINNFTVMYKCFLNSNMTIRKYIYNYDKFNEFYGIFFYFQKIPDNLWKEIQAQYVAGLIKK